MIKNRIHSAQEHIKSRAMPDQELRKNRRTHRANTKQEQNNS
jgi:hypothetical protein